MSYFSVDIYTPSKILVKNVPADSLLVPTVRGEINILPDHTHTVSKLDTGVLTIQASGKKDEHYLVTTGVCKVLNNKVTILSDVAEHSPSIDANRAKKALDKALAKLNGEEALRDEEIRKFQRKKERAEARLRAAYLK